MSRRAAMLCLCACLTAAAVEPDFTSLFDGESLDGWTLVDGHGPGYMAEEKVLICPANGGGNLFTAKEYSDFIFRFDFRMEPGGNSGVGIRAPLQGDAAYVGMEIQILDDGHSRYEGWLKPTQYHGSIYDVIPARPGFLRPAGEWNTQEITADGRHIQVVVNGVIVVDTNLDIVKEPEILERHPGLARQTGHVGFLGHGTRVEFRNIRIKELRHE